MGMARNGLLYCSVKYKDNYGVNDIIKVLQYNNFFGTGIISGRPGASQGNCAFWLLFRWVGIDIEMVIGKSIHGKFSIS